MTAIKNRKWYSPARQIPFILFGGLFVFITACNNSSESKQEKKDSLAMDDTATTSAVDPSGKATDFSKNKMFTVRVTIQNFKDIFQSNTAGNEVRMIYFEFDGSRYSEGYSLRAFGANKDGDPVTNTEIQLDTVGQGSILSYVGGAVPPEYSQAVTRGHIKDFLGQPTGTKTPIDGRHFKEVWLTPCFKPGTDTIYYAVSYHPGAGDPIPACPKEIRKNAEGSIITNPSPPDNPCLENCDEAQFMFKPKWK